MQHPRTLLRVPRAQVGREALYPFGVLRRDVPLLAGKGFVDGRPAVYVCERFVCRAPMTDVGEIRADFGGNAGRPSHVPAG